MLRNHDVQFIASSSCHAIVARIAGNGATTDPMVRNSIDVTILSIQLVICIVVILKTKSWT